MCIGIAPSTTVLNKVSSTRLNAKNGSHFIRKWFLLNSFGGTVLLGGDLQIYAKNSNFETSDREHPLYEIWEYAFKLK